MKTPHLYINQYVKTPHIKQKRYLSYLIAIYVFQIKFDLKNLNGNLNSFISKQSFDIFNLL